MACHHFALVRAVALAALARGAVDEEVLAESHAAAVVDIAFISS